MGPVDSSGRPGVGPVVPHRRHTHDHVELGQRQACASLHDGGPGGRGQFELRSKSVPYHIQIGAESDLWDTITEQTSRPVPRLGAI